MSGIVENRIIGPDESVARLWLEFCDYYNRVSYQIELINRSGMELSRCVWVEGFEDKASLEEDVRIHFIDEDKNNTQLVAIEKACSRSCVPSFIFSFLSSTAASNFLSRRARYRGTILTGVLLTDLVRRLKLESRPRNFRDETAYKEKDMDRRMLVILDTDNAWEKEDFIKILIPSNEKHVLEHVFRCEIGEGFSKYHSGLYILTFEERICKNTCDQIVHEQVLYAGLLREYIALRRSLMQQNPINKKLITIPLSRLGHNLESLSIQSEENIRCSVELSGFFSVYADIRDYMIKVLELEYVERSREKVSEPHWVKEQEGHKAIFHFHVCDQKSNDLVQKWNDQNVQIKGCKIKAKIL